MANRSTGLEALVQVGAGLFVIATLSAPLAAAELPTVQFVAGDVQLLRADGSQTPARKGDVIQPGDRLLTGAQGVAQVRAATQGVVALRPASEIEFKSAPAGLDVALTQGQVRAVTDLAGHQRGLLRVVTPDSKIAVTGGDIETGLVPHAGGTETFSQVRTGEVSLDTTGGPQALAIGQTFKTTGDGSLGGQSMPALITETMAPPLEASDSELPASLPAPPAGTVNSLPRAALPAKLPDIASLGSRSRVGLPPGDPKLAVPEVKVEVGGVSIAGASSEVNQSLSTLPILVAGRVGQDKNLTFSNEAALPIKGPKTVFQPSTIELPNKQLVEGFAPPSNTKVLTQGTSINQLVLVAQTPVTPGASTPPQVVGQLLNPTTLTQTSVVKPTTPTITTGLKFSGLRR